MAMTTHLMIVPHRSLGPILTGRQTIEPRLGTDRGVPFGLVSEGDRVYIKPNGGRVAAQATVRRVDEFEDLTPEDILALRETYNDRILGPDEFWDAKIESRFATLVTLERVGLIHTERGIPEELLAPGRDSWRVADGSETSARRTAA